MQILFHADDFGITPAQSRRILDCHDGGLLNSLSVLVTSPRFEECARLLDPIPDGLRVGLHLNVVEGHCAADPADLPLLVDGEGVFRQSFAGMLALSLGRRREELVRELEVEIAAQVELFVGRFPQMRDHLRVDGHQHFQLIPAVFDALLAVLGDGRYHVDYLRIPVEPAGPFMKPGILASTRPVNWAKHWALGWCWHRDRARLPDYARVSALFCGVIFSGRMDAGRVSEVLPAYLRRARAAGMDLELLFHPGRVDGPEECLNPALDGFVAFSCGEGRDVEAAALRGLRLDGDVASGEARLVWGGR